VSPDEIISDLNATFFVASVTDDGYTVYTRVVFEDAEGNLCCESFRSFRERFPVKRFINDRVRNIGSFWLKNPRRRTLDSPILFREVQIKRRIETDGPTTSIGKARGDV
jgi:hypothetical protein